MKRRYLPLIVLPFAILVSWGAVKRFMETFTIVEAGIAVIALFFILFLLALVVDLIWKQR